MYGELVNIDSVISFLNRVAAEAYERDGDDSIRGHGYSSSAIRVWAAFLQGELGD